MKSKALAAAGLILGFSANSIFAETGQTKQSEYNSLMDRITQAQKNSVYAKSVSLDAILNTKTESSKPETGARGVTKLPKTRSPENDKKPAPVKLPKPAVNGRQKTVREKFDELRNLGNFNPMRTTGKSSKILPKKNSKYFDAVRLSKRDAKFYEVIMDARNLDQLSAQEKIKVVRLHRKMLKTEIVQNMLDTIQKGEGGSPRRIVGEGKGKSREFKQKMDQLDLSTHPFYQFPKGMRCFFYNSQVGKCSTASGNYQITVTNFDYYRRQLGLKDFSIETQQIIAMELIRTGRAKIVRGNYKGRGYVELLKGNLKKAIRYGTNDWASSPYSEWKGAKTPYIKDAEMIAKSRKSRKSERLKDVSYFQKWIDETDAQAE